MRHKADELKHLGARIRQLRKKQRLTQEELAERCGIHYKFLGGIERGDQNPTIIVLGKIAKALHVSLADLFDYEHVVSTPQRLREQLTEGIKQSSDAELLVLYRVYRSL
ncbi:MAG: helix-turn-helix domain-containing protein [Terriglobia bacterium]